MPYAPRHFPDHLYFITATLLGWRPLLTRPDFATIILDSLNWHRSQSRLALYAYVVMPTHFHSIIKPAGERTISGILQSLGSFTAHAILKQLLASNLAEDLRYFGEHRQPDRTEQHQVWQPIQAKNIHSPEFLREKLDYIHNNPVAKKWRLADDRAAYRFSSARFYDLGEAPIVPVDDVREWLV